MKSCRYKKDWAINSIIKTKKVYKFPSLPSRRYLISRTSNNVLPRLVSRDKSFRGFNPRTNQLATRVFRVASRELEWVGVWKERGAGRNLYSRFGRLSCALQAWWLCAAMRLCYHTIEHLSYVHIPSFLFSLFLSFFLFFFILNPWSRFGDNQSEGDRGLESSRSESCGRARH